MKVVLEEIINALFTADDNVDCYYDKKKHEVFVVADYIEYEMSEDELEEYLDSDDLLRLPSKYEIHEYKMMEEFIDTLTPSVAKEQLWEAIRGKGAFRRFKQCVNYHGIEKMWYHFHDEGYRKIAIDWCEANHLEFKEKDD
ncbi:MAG: UPF0158 family protein [Eubacteriales bacterium]